MSHISILCQMSSTSLSKPQGKKKELLALAAANGVGEPSMARWLRVADGWLFEVTGKDDDALAKTPRPGLGSRICYGFSENRIFWYIYIPNSNRLWRLSVCSVWKLMKRGLPHWQTTAVDSSPSSLLLSNHEHVVIRGMCYGQFLKNAILMFCPCS